MTDETAKGERIAKIIARAGLCSRREAEVLVAQGRVALDGRPVTEPGTTVLPGQRVTVDGEALPAPEPPRLFRFHKPVGVLTTARDPEGRETFYDGLPEGLPRLMPVGRLDINSEGLLLLTNDGGLKRHLELPGTGWLRRYRVRVWGRVDTDALAGLAEGVTVEGVRYGPIQARLDVQSASNAWLTFTLQEGKNREIRQVCRHLGLQVNRLIRIAYGPFQLGVLPERAIEEVPQKVLKEQLGAFLETLTPPDPPPGERPRRGRPAPLPRRVIRPAPAPKTKTDETKSEEPPAKPQRKGRGGWSPVSGEAEPPPRERNKARSWGEKPAPAKPAAKPVRRPKPEGRWAEEGTARAPGQERRRPGAPPRGRGRPEERDEGGRPQRGERSERGPFGKPRGEGFKGKGSRDERPRREGPREDRPREERPRGRPPGDRPTGDKRPMSDRKPGGRPPGPRGPGQGGPRGGSGGGGPRGGGGGARRRG